MTAEAWAIGEVKTAIDRAGVEGISIESLRAEAGIGHDDLVDVLNHLRERGDAVEGAPGEWRAPFDDEVEPDGTDGVGGEQVAEMSPEERARAAMAPDGPPPRTPGAENVGRRPLAPAVPGLTRAMPEYSEIVLTATVLKAMSAEVIGAIVEAGVSEAGEVNHTFVLRVEP